MISKDLWTFNAYVWALVAAFWGWMAFTIAGTAAGDVSILVALGSAALTVLSVREANR